MRWAKALALDLLLVLLATLAAFYIRTNLDLDLDVVVGAWRYFACSLVAALIILPASGVTRTLWRFAGLSSYGRLLVASGLIALSAMGMSFVIDRLAGVPRSIPVLQALAIVTLLGGLRLIERLHRFRHGRRAQPEIQKSAEKVMLVGVNAIAELFVQLAAEQGKGNVEIVAVVGSRQRDGGRVLDAGKITGTLDDIERIVADAVAAGQPIGRIVLAVPSAGLNEAVSTALARLAQSGSIEIDYFADRMGFG